MIDLYIPEPTVCHLVKLMLFFSSNEGEGEGVQRELARLYVYVMPVAHMYHMYAGVLINFPDLHYLTAV